MARPTRRTVSRAQRLRNEAGHPPEEELAEAANAEAERLAVEGVLLPVAPPAGGDGGDPPHPLEQEDDDDDEDEMAKLKVSLMLKRLGMSKKAANHMVNEQSIDSIDMLITLDDDEITQLCKSCRKDSSITDDGERSKGIGIAVVAETNFKLANFLIKLWKMTNRPVDLEIITQDTVRQIKDFKQELTSRKDPSPEAAPKLHQDKAFEFFEAFKEYLSEHTGSVSKRPLAYVMRDQTKVTPSAEDPPFGEDNSKYISYYDEIEHRAPIKVVGSVNSIILKPDAHFSQDNVRVYKLLHAALKGTNNLTHIKSYAKKSDGREALIALHKQLLGGQAIQNYAAKAENRLNSLALDGTKRRNWNFDKYVIAHVEQHHILEKLIDHGYKGIDENSKMRLFQQGITDPYYSTVRGAVSAAPKATFDELVEAYRTFAQTDKQNRPQQKQSLNISAVNQQTGNRYREPGGRPTTQSDGYDPNKDYSTFASGVKLNTYYKGQEWNNLTKNQRNYLRSEKAKKKSASKENKRHNSHISQLETMNATISDLKSTIASLVNDKANPAEDDVGSSTSPKRTKVVRK
jgi:hypothetical protein